MGNDNAAKRDNGGNGCWRSWSKRERSLYHGMEQRAAAYNGPYLYLFEVFRGDTARG